MLTLKLITEEKDRVVRGLEKKHFPNAAEAVEEVLNVDKTRRQAQAELDANLSKAKKMAAEIGGLMKQGKKQEAEEVKAEVAQLKEANRKLEETKSEAEAKLVTLLCAIPNIPYEIVPEGSGAEDNWVVKSSLKECVEGKDTVGNWDANPVIESARLPHWELAKKYNLIDFDLGVKITGAGFPVYRGMGAKAAACTHQLLPRRGSSLWLRGDYASHSGQPGQRLRHRTAARQGGSDVSLQSG